MTGLRALVWYVSHHRWLSPWDRSAAMVYIRGMILRHCVPPIDPRVADSIAHDAVRAWHTRGGREHWTYYVREACRGHGINPDMVPALSTLHESRVPRS